MPQKNRKAQSEMGNMIKIVFSEVAVRLTLLRKRQNKEEGL